ncbi:hypothetical protein [Streptomyces sp. NPDC059552]|uniref:hypothetical protein n=1 Tax=Streptomyces TaxID=1883 RepID=UPI00324983A9
MAPTDPPKRRLEGPTRVVALIGGIVAIVATTLGAVTAWPEDWWPRRLPTPKIFITSVQGHGESVIPYPASVLDNPPAEVKDGCSRQAMDWINSLAPVPTETLVSFVLTTEREESVVVVGLKPLVERVDGQAMKTVVEECIGGDGYLIRRADIVVDETPAPRFKFTNEEGKAIAGVELKLGKGGAAEFHIHSKAKTPGTVFEWTADVELLIGGEPTSLRLSNRGKPFKVAGPHPGRPVVNVPEKVKEIRVGGPSGANG